MCFLTSPYIKYMFKIALQISKSIPQLPLPPSPAQKLIHYTTHIGFTHINLTLL